MKRTIIVLLVALMVATPCLAQEIEPDGLFSIDGTKWQALPIGLQIFPLPGIWETDGLEFGFYGGEGYIDMLVFSIFNTGYSLSTCLTGGGSTSYFGILQPIGIGIVVELYVSSSPGVPAMLNIGFLIKISNDWEPPEVEPATE